MQYDWCPHQKGTFGHTHSRRMPHEDGGRDQGDVSASQGRPRTAGNHQRPEERVSLRAPRRNHPCLGLGLAASRTGRQYISIVKATQSGVRGQDTWQGVVEAEMGAGP